MSVTATSKLKLRKIGNSVGIILPNELLAVLRAGEGDEIFVTQNASGLELSAYDPNFEADMEAFQEVRKQYKNALRKLAR